MNNNLHHRLYVCITCKGENLDVASFEGEGRTQGEKLYSILKDASAFQHEELTIIPTQCLSACKRGCAVAFSASTKYSYVFGEIDTTLLPDLAIMTKTYIQSLDGALKKIHRPESLQKKVVARIPPLSS